MSELAQPICVAGRECPISHSPCPGECVFAPVMQSVNLGIVLFDTATKTVLFANGEAGALFGDWIGLRDYDGLSALLLAGQDAAPSALPFSPPALRLGDKILGYTVYGAGRFVWVFVRDITEKERLEAVAEAVELMNTIGYVFSTVRHEVGNPINSVKTALTVLRRNVRSFAPEALEEYLEKSLSELSRVEDLLASLKSFSVYEDLRVRDMQIAPFLETTALLAFPELQKRGIQPSLIIDPAARAARFDPRALQQVLLNLLTNAADALDGRPGNVRIRTRPQPGAVALCVEDDGCGVSEEHWPHLFQPFFSSKPGGTGLGLVIAKKMMVRMGGTIDLESQPGQGTVVTLVLPEATIGEQ